ncbi:hypothetical protein LCGC14_0392350 [marine sediment metagenome]|uniref:Uncharacterized protein n=1 Tax=marine sediment metagenome TaxID=412755 RepID=A0A0F9VLE9_9ZZZZ
MTDAAQAFAIPTRLNDQYELSPLSLSDIGRLDERIKSKVVALGKEMIKDQTLSQADKSLIMDRAFKVATSISMFGVREGNEEADLEMTRMLNDPGMMTYILWLSLKTKHPKLSPEDVDGMFTIKDKQRLMEAVVDVFTVSGFTVEDVDDADLNPKPKGSAVGKPFRLGQGDDDDGADVRMGTKNGGQSDTAPTDNVHERQEVRGTKDSAGAVSG